MHTNGILLFYNFCAKMRSLPVINVHH